MHVTQVHCDFESSPACKSCYFLLSSLTSVQRSLEQWFVATLTFAQTWIKYGQTKYLFKYSAPPTPIVLGRTVSRLRVPNEYANSNFMSSGNRNITFPSCNHLAICTQFIHTHTYTSIWFPVPCREFQFASCTCIDCGQFGWQAVSEPSCLRRSVPPKYGGLYKTLQLFHNSRRLLCFLNCNFVCVLTSRQISII